MHFRNFNIASILSSYLLLQDKNLINNNKLILVHLNNKILILKYKYYIYLFAIEYYEWQNVKINVSRSHFLILTSLKKSTSVFAIQL